MKKLRALLPALAIGLLAFIGWKAFSHFGRPKQIQAQPKGWACPMRCLGKLYDKPGHCTVCHMDLVALERPKKPLGYSCPLHYSKTIFDKPGQCPFCSLQLKAIYEDPSKPSGRFDPWEKIGGRTAVSFRPYTVGLVQVDRLVRVAGSLSQGRRLLTARLPQGEPRPKVGDSAMMSPPLGYGKPVLGLVESLGGGLVAIRSDRPFEGLRHATAEIRIQGPRVLAVPLEAVREFEDKAYAFRKEGEDYVPQALKLGLKGERFWEVLEGLKEGDVVAGSGVFWLEAQWRLEHPSESLN